MAVTRVLSLVAMSALYLLHGLTRVLGLLAVQCPSSRIAIRRVRMSGYWRIHGWLMMIFLGVYSPFAFWSIYNHMPFLRHHKMLLLVSLNRFGALLLWATLCLWISCSKQAEIIECLNGLLKCQRLLHRLMYTQELKDSLNCLANRNNVTKLVLFIVFIVMAAAQPMQILIDDPEVRTNFVYAFSLVFVYSCQLILQLSLAIFTLILLFVAHLVRHSNLLLARTLADVGGVLESSRRARLGPDRQRLYGSQQQWLAFELLRVLHLHQKLLKLHQCICRLHGVQAVCFVVYVPIECMVHLFFSYFMRYSKFILRKYGKSLPFNYYGICFLIGLFSCLLLVILGTRHSERQFSRTRETFRSAVCCFPSECTDKKLIYTLHYYGLFLKNARHIFTVSACGLFRLDNVLLFCIVGAVLNYLMILIQFDKLINK
ncbi:putative gustatory receptor 77a [Drosophila bipectinata]|uniref:putative gustatory receptor 77a n=1 Tax=Drosophila bipectinata TaxID=42026 RepID=UPI001C88ECFB|nr:putative gustatory receptor 77a [Drosophila bipectinata]